MSGSANALSCGKRAVSLLITAHTKTSGLIASVIADASRTNHAAVGGPVPVFTAQITHASRLVARRRTHSIQTANLAGLFTKVTPKSGITRSTRAICINTRVTSRAANLAVVLASYTPSAVVTNTKAGRVPGQGVLTRASI